MLLGRNGAGKTTTLRTIMGLWQASAGTIRFDGRDIDAACRRRISPAPASPTCRRTWRIFSDLTVRENLVLAARDGPLDDDAARLDLRLLPGAEEILALPRAGTLSGGQKQMLAIARAIVEPRKLLLIDEPTKGLAPAIVAALIAAFRELKRATPRSCWSSRTSASRAALGDTCRGDGRRPHRACAARWPSWRTTSALQQAPARPVARRPTNETTRHQRRADHPHRAGEAPRGQP